MEASNVKAMREALSRARRTLSRWKNDTPVSAWYEFDLAMDEIDTALAAPPRNCDVGTLQEQEARYRATGRLYHTSTLQNVLSWAQMPYKEKEGASK